MFGNVLSIFSNANLQGRAESLTEKLREARECERKLEEKFRAELSAQTRLATLYKSHSEEHNNKVKHAFKLGAWIVMCIFMTKF